jgi:hypothetical protein
VHLFRNIPYHINFYKSIKLEPNEPLYDTCISIFISIRLFSHLHKNLTKTLTLLSLGLPSLHACFASFQLSPPSCIHTCVILTSCVFPLACFLSHNFSSSCHSSLCTLSFPLWSAANMTPTLTGDSSQVT